MGGCEISVTLFNMFLYNYQTYYSTSPGGSIAFLFKSKQVRQIHVHHSTCNSNSLVSSFMFSHNLHAYNTGQCCCCIVKLWHKQFFF